MPYKPNDHYARKAKKENFVARSVYKLEEIDKRHKIIHSGFNVLDLGASPGSWSQYASKKIGEKGRILGIDLKPIFLQLSNAVFIKADLNKIDVQEIVSQYNFSQLFDAVISDMAPNTTGNKFVDQMASHNLCVVAFETAKKFLKPRGNFVCKIFEGEDTMQLRDEMKNSFDEVHILRPKSTQTSSKEMFLIGLKFKANSVY